MSEMEVKPGYKQTELGAIPEDWGIDSLSNKTSKIGSGITPTGGERVYKKEGKPFIRSQNVGWGSLNLTDVAFIDLSTHESFIGTEIKDADLLLNITGASIGRCSIANEKIVGGNVNQHVCIIRVNQSELNPRYVLFVTLSRIGQAQIDSFQAGGNRQGLNFEQIGRIIVPIPPLPEQTAIATALSDVDALISGLDQLIEKKRAIKQAAMQELLTGKRRLPGFKGSWNYKKLGDISVSYSGGTPNTNKIEYFGGKIPWVSISDMTRCGKFISQTERTLSVQGFDNCAAKLFPPFTILYAMYASIGECSISEVELCSSQAILGIIPNKSINCEYLYYYLVFKKNDILEMRQQGTQKNLNAMLVRSIDIPISSLPEQTAIATVLSDMDAEISALETRRAKTISLKQGMMQELLTGRVRLV